MRATIRVFDETGLADFAKGLNQLGFEMLNIGGAQMVLDYLVPTELAIRYYENKQTEGATQPREMAGTLIVGGTKNGGKSGIDARRSDGRGGSSPGQSSGTVDGYGQVYAQEAPEDKE